MRKAKVFCHNILAGFLEESSEGDFTFTYDKAYLENSKLPPVSLTLPKQKAAYRSKELHPFFDGLIPEGWLLNLSTKNWKLNPSDRMGLLLSACRECIGACHIEPFDPKDSLR